MEIEIKKTQETVNDIPKEAEYSITLTRRYGTGDLKHSTFQLFTRLTLEDMHAFRDRLNKDFPKQK